MTSLLRNDAPAEDTTGFEVQRLGPFFGARIPRLDLHAASDAQVGALRAALTEH